MAVTVILYLCCFALVAVRWLHILNPNVYVISTEVNLHITNFTLCLEACLLIGYLQLLFGTGYASFVATGVLVVVVNLLYEGFLRFMNTPDLMDAMYGAAGVLVALVYLWLVSRYGLVKKE